jgi:hypothetical protein
MSVSNTPSALLTAEEAVQKIQNNILSNAQPHVWLTQYVQVNQVTLSTLIENDTFGDLSEFDEENPAPEPIEQVKILKAFLKKENQCGPHDVKAITTLLKGFIERTVDQQRVVDNLLLQAQLRREERWGVSLPTTTTLDVQLYALNIIQILNKMERMLDSIEQETQDKTELKNWVSQQRTQIANNPFAFRNPANVINLPYFMAGADQISKFVRKEIQAVLDLYTSTRAKISKISEFSPRAFFQPDRRFDNIFRDTLRYIAKRFVDATKFTFNLLDDGGFFALRIGLLALLPYRLALTLCREVNHQVGKGVRFVANKFLPERFRWVAKIPELVAWYILASYYAPYFSMSMILGLQFFPKSWGWDFIGKLALGFSASELLLGTTLAIGKFCKRVWDNRRAAAQLVPVPVPVVLVPAPLLAPAANDIGIALNPEQKKKLQLLLMRENMSVDANQEISAEKKAKKKGKIGEEQTRLYDTTTAYTLSKLDKKLLAKQADLPSGFENLEAEIRAITPRASVG